MAEDFLKAYQAHVWDVYAFFAYRLGSRPDAEDLTQLTFERAWRAWDRYDPRRASVSTWLMAIARNAYVDHLRRRRSPGDVPLDETVSESVHPSSEGPEARLGPDPALAAAIGRLGAREQEVLALRFGGDLPTAEIASVLEISVANAQQILSRAVRKLRRALDEDEGQPPVPGVSSPAPEARTPPQ
jgi:RNA polymerase sigma-70 factor (ECF subfamily)